MDTQAERMPTTVGVTVIAWAVSSVALIGLIPCIGLIAALPRMEQVFKDLGITLPVLTDVMISLHRWGALWFIVLLLAGGMILPTAVARDPRWRIGMPLLCLFLALATMLVLASAIALPLTVIVESLGKAQNT